MGTIVEDEIEESLDNLGIEQITEAQLKKMASEFNVRMRSYGEGIKDALTGGVFEKGEKGLKDIQNELASGSVVSFIRSKQAIVRQIEAGGKTGNTPAQTANIKAVCNFVDAYKKTSYLLNGFRILFKDLESGAMDCSFRLNLFIQYLTMMDVNSDFRHELCDVYRHFEELATYYKTIDKTTDIDTLANTFFDAHTKEYEKTRKYLDQKLSQAYPSSYKYLDPFKMHNVYGSLHKMKCIDDWTKSYWPINEHLEKLRDARKVLDDLAKDIQEAEKENHSEIFSTILSGYNEACRNISYGTRGALDHAKAIESGSDTSPYWIMKYESNIIATKSKYGIGNSSDVIRKGTDYYDSFKLMSEKLGNIAADAISTAIRNRRAEIGYF